MNAYKRKRIKNKLSKYVIAREMGFSLEQWDKVENGAVYLDKEYLDKFNDVISRSKELNFNRTAKLQMIKTKIASGELKKKVQDQGYNFTTLGRKLGKQPSSICNIFALRSCPDDTIEEMYDFLMNPTNKKIEKEEKPIIKKEEQREEHIETNVEEHIETQSRTQNETQPTPTFTNLEQKIAMLEKEKEILLMQIIRYEKLIDKM